MIHRHLKHIQKTLDFFNQWNPTATYRDPDPTKNLGLVIEQAQFTEIDLPWVVKEQTSNITKPSDRRDFSFLDKVLVGSGEQSFIELMLRGKLTENRPYIGTTPCFRDEELIDETHFNYFLKTELFVYIETTPNIYKNFDNVKLTSNVLCSLAFENFIKNWNFLDLKNVQTSEAINSLDIIDNKTGIELGSYGMREYKHNKENYLWAYGTAIAEPRFSYVLDKYIE